MKAGREALEYIKISEAEKAEFAENVAHLKEGLKLYSHSQPFRIFSSGKQSSHDLAHYLMEIKESPYFNSKILREQLTTEEYESLFRLPTAIKAESLGLSKNTHKLGEIFEMWFSTTFPNTFSLHGDREAALEVMWAIISNTPANLTSLDLSSNDIGQEGAVPLILLLRDNIITSLDLSSNNIYRGFTSMYNQMWYGQDVAHFGNALAKNTVLKTLDLSYNPVDIRSRYIVEGLAHGMAKNQSITKLNLSGCGMDLGAGSNFHVFMRALKQNNTLLDLDLSNNNIDRSGAVALLEMLQAA